MSNYTKGPWSAHGWSVYAEDGMPVAMAAADVLADTLESYYGAKSWARFNEGSGRNEAEAAANARLMADAPTLLQLGYELAMVVLQSELYCKNADATESVDNILSVYRKH